MDLPEKAELDERKKAFLEGYGELRDKHQIDIAFIPAYVPDGQGGFKTVVRQELVGLEQLSVPSKADDFI